jgi:hypothetical protein
LTLAQRPVLVFGLNIPIVVAPVGRDAALLHMVGRDAPVRGGFAIDALFFE